MMSEIDSIDEILEFAIAREVEANQLYMYMARCMKNPEMREVCEGFAKEELEHKAKLELEVMKRGQIVSALEICDYMMDVGSPMDMEYEQLLVFAINKEKLSINLYTDLAKIVKDIDSRETLLSIVEEETKHKERFEVEHSSLHKGI